MWHIVGNWYKRYLSDPEAIILLLTLLVIIALFWLFGSILAPVLVSIVLAYLLNSLITYLEKLRCPHTLAVIIVSLFFIGLLLLFIFWLLPMLWQQMTNLFHELPNILARGQNLIMTLPEKYPRFIALDQITYVLNVVKSEVGNAGKVILSASLASIPNIIEIIVYTVLVPLMVFFFLKDNKKIINWLSQFLPRRRRVIGEVWQEVNLQLGNYVRGRVLEMLIVSIVTTITFIIFGLQYSVLLGVLVGLATIIPYIGAVVSTIPVIIIAFVQWGLSPHFAYLLLAYTVISILDSNVLVPLLFSETLDLHPVAIIVAVIFFGGIWGFWGAFFSIPLASVVKAVIAAWPRNTHKLL